MEKFSAENFSKIATCLAGIDAVLWKDGNKYRDVSPEGRTQTIKWLEMIARGCREIALKESSKSADRLSVDLGATMIAVVLGTRVRELQKLIRSEMESQLFFWVPSHRAEWYGKDAQSLLGAICCSRFSSVHRDIEEASSCYAFGRYTACAFHLMRVTEAGVRALAKAIGFTIPNQNWGRVFGEFRRQQALSAKPAHWTNRFKRLSTIGAHLQAVEHGWRNRIAHLDEIYLEEQAKLLLTVIPAFLADIAKTIDENGNFV